MSGRVGVKGSGFRRAVTSRSVKVLITAVVVVTFAWRGYVLTFTTSDPYEGPSSGIWLLVWGIYLLLRYTLLEQPRSEADQLLPDKSREA